MSSQAAVSISASSMKPLHLLRGLYRQLKTPLLSKELINKKSSPTYSATTTTTAETDDDDKLSRSNESTRFLMQQYRTVQSSSSSNSNTNETKRWRHLAIELYQLRQDIVARGELYTLDAGADQQLSPQELSRRAAARAGLQLPQQYKE